MLKAFIVLLLFQLIGETLVDLTGLPIPGPVIGMLLLWIGLHVKNGASSELTSLSDNLIRHLSLLFLPAGVGLFFLPAEIQRYWPAVLGAMVAGTFVSMLFSGWLVKSLSRGNGGGHG
ncbi:MAG: CidA/LrgA family protein [Candidatus Pelagadaptatus aseana]|uniref:CidA/LrgA family protein n=1 Tax=Candidatus Pelagadaptatus aseana TaxID=3120508 RepID=UPI0039B2CB56